MLQISRNQLRVHVFRDFVKLPVVLIRKRDVQRLRRDAPVTRRRRTSAGFLPGESNAETSTLPSTTTGNIALPISLFPSGGDFRLDVLFGQPVDTLSQRIGLKPVQCPHRLRLPHGGENFFRVVVCFLQVGNPQEGVRTIIWTATPPDPSSSGIPADSSHPTIS